MRKLENLKIYTLSYDFLLEIYKVLPLLPDTELRNIYSQLQRATTSIVLNIAEGASNKSNKVFLNHLQYSFGSCKEVQVLLNLMKDLDYINSKTYKNLFKNLDDLTASIFKFMTSIEEEVKYRLDNYKLRFNFGKPFAC